MHLRGLWGHQVPSELSLQGSLPESVTGGLGWSEVQGRLGTTRKTLTCGVHVSQGRGPGGPREGEKPGKPPEVHRTVFYWCCRKGIRGEVMQHTAPGSPPPCRGEPCAPTRPQPALQGPRPPDVSLGAHQSCLFLSLCLSALGTSFLSSENSTHV